MRILAAFMGLVLMTSTAHSSDLKTVKMARSYQKFSKEVLDEVQAVRKENLPINEHWTISSGGQPISLLLSQIIQHLAEKSNLTKYLENPDPIFVVVQENEADNSLVSQMKAGILTINRAMLELATTDDELAEILGHEMLHHTLAHTLQMSELKNTYYFRAMSIGEGTTVFGSEVPMPWDRRQELHKEKYEAVEREARIASLKVLQNAGLDPWAHVSLWEKQLAHYEKFRDRRFTGKGEDLQAIIEEGRTWLTKMKIEPRTEHKTEWVSALKALLDTTSAPARNQNR